jgi:hypothetical protein
MYRQFNETKIRALCGGMLSTGGTAKLMSHQLVYYDRKCQRFIEFEEWCLLGCYAMWLL